MELGFAARFRFQSETRETSEKRLDWKRKKGDFRLFPTEAKQQSAEAKCSEKKNVEQNDAHNYLIARQKILIEIKRFFILETVKLN
jgi:hypothetical protein